MLFAVILSRPAGAACLDEAGVAAIEETGFGGDDYRPFLDAQMPSGDYGYEIRQDGNSFLIRAFRPNFVFAYLVAFNGADAWITARYTTYDLLDDGPDEGSYTIYYMDERKDYVALCGAGNAGALTVDPILAILDELRKLVRD